MALQQTFSVSNIIAIVSLTFTIGGILYAFWKRKIDSALSDKKTETEMTLHIDLLLKSEAETKAELKDHSRRIAVLETKIENE